VIGYVVFKANASGIAGAREESWNKRGSRSKSLVTVVTFLNPGNVRQLADSDGQRISRGANRGATCAKTGGGEGAKTGKTKREETTGARYQTMIIDPLLLCSGSCTLIQSARTRMFRIDVIRQFRVKVGGRSRFSPMRIALVSIPLLVAPIFFAPGGGNGKPSKYLRASIYPARVSIERGR